MTRITNASALKKLLPTKLGKIEYTAEDVFFFRNGIYGFNNLKNFAVSAFFCESTLEKYKCFQSVEEGVTLIIMNTVVSLSRDSLVNAADLDIHLHLRGLRLKDVIICLITSVHNEAGKHRISVNTQAPIILAPNRQEGWQVILDSHNYTTKHFLV